MLVQQEVLCQTNNRESSVPTKVRAIYKWECDFTSGYQKYNQCFAENESEGFYDTFLFVISFLHLQLIGETRSILWQNQQPSPAAFCRPIKIIFAKESEYLLKN